MPEKQGRKPMGRNVKSTDVYLLEAWERAFALLYRLWWAVWGQRILRPVVGLLGGKKEGGVDSGGGLDRPGPCVTLTSSVLRLLCSRNYPRH